MSQSKKQKSNVEKIVCIILIILTFISIVSSMFNFAYLFYSNTYINTYINNIDKINSFLLKYNTLMVIDNILIFIVAILYIILGIKSKKEVILKVSFSIFSILTTMIVLTLIVNVIAKLFGIFG